MRNRLLLITLCLVNLLPRPASPELLHSDRLEVSPEDGSSQVTLADTEPKAGIRQLEVFIGQWDIVLRSEDQQIVGLARTEVRYILDGTAMQADYFGLDRQGNTVFRGTTLRTHDPQTGRFVVHWAMANLPGFTYIDEVYRQGELHGDGRGFDEQGEFVERYRYFDIGETSYSFEMSRSYDGGVTWQSSPKVSATRRSTESPPRS